MSWFSCLVHPSRKHRSMCLNLNINSNGLPKAVLNHHKVLFNKNSNALVKLCPLTMESGRGKYASVTTKP